jgi:A/G-specific adenine glycosylase
MDSNRAQREPVKMPTAMAEKRPASSLPRRKFKSKFKSKFNDVSTFRRALVRWYDQHRRDLPWRRTCDPYRIWLSEIMLQQTRVAAVLDHYRIFLERFPNIHTLAGATADAVLAAWSGLGYYRRARMLHRCAQQIVENYDGRFPDNSEALRALPGIGRYTAAAVASIAFGEPIAVVDGNVERVLHRFTGIDLTTPQTWHHAQALLAISRPADFNQAMMELGATVCVPREPRCPACPVRKWCAAQGQGEVPRSVLPFRQNVRQKKRQIWCSLEHRENDRTGGGKIRLVQRPQKDSLMPGMWELPQTSEPPAHLPDSSRWRTFRHSITVTDYTVHVLRHIPIPNGLPARTDRNGKSKWIAIDRLPEIPITGLTRKILKAGGII